jgi:prephenate dehydratase
MATKEQNLARVEKGGIVAIVRTQSSEQLVQVAEAIKALQKQSVFLRILGSYPAAL